MNQQTIVAVSAIILVLWTLVAMVYALANFKYVIDGLRSRGWKKVTEVAILFPVILFWLFLCCVERICGFLAHGLENLGTHLRA